MKKSSVAYEPKVDNLIPQTKNNLLNHNLFAASLVLGLKPKTL